MTNLQEAKLSREAEICFSTIALVTDFDCWHESEETVTIEAVIQNLVKNAVQAKKIIRNLINILPRERTCPCREALKDAIITDQKKIPNKIKEKLHPIIGKYL
jgi:5'-methylthioadenosine phosphorylase